MVSPVRGSVIMSCRNLMRFCTVVLRRFLDRVTFFLGTANHKASCQDGGSEGLDNDGRMVCSGELTCGRVGCRSVNKPSRCHRRCGFHAANDAANLGRTRDMVFY